MYRKQEVLQRYISRAGWKGNTTNKLAQNPEVKKVLGFHHSLYCNIQSLKLLLAVPVCKLGDLHPFILPEDLTSSAGMLSRDYKVDVLRGLSLLGLCLVIAASHVAVVNNFEPFNFEMVFNEYKALTEKSGCSVQLFSKPVVMKAFDNLLHLNLVCPVDGGTAKTMKEFKLMELNVLEDQVKEAVKTYRECPRDVTEWAMRRGCGD